MEGKKKKMIAGSVVALVGAVSGLIFYSKKKKAKNKKSKNDKQ